jgi:hypothetical protein
MSFRIIPSFLPRSRMSAFKVGRGGKLQTISVGGGSRQPKFYHEWWDPAVLELYYPLTTDTSFNPGQLQITNDYQQDIENYLFEIGQDYHDREFLAFLVELMGESKYNALSETWEKLSIELINQWDHAYSHEKFAQKKFFGVVYK